LSLPTKIVAIPMQYAQLGSEIGVLILPLLKCQVPAGKTAPKKKGKASSKCTSASPKKARGTRFGSKRGPYKKSKPAAADSEEPAVSKDSGAHIFAKLMYQSAGVGVDQTAKSRIFCCL
jgi:hypothetical protein